MASQQVEGAGGGWRFMNIKVYVPFSGSLLSGQCELYAHVLDGVLTLWSETFLGNTVLPYYDSNGCYIEVPG
jgi:hypothetical protein